MDDGRVAATSWAARHAQSVAPASMDFEPQLPHGAEVTASPRLRTILRAGMGTLWGLHATSTSAGETVLVCSDINGHAGYWHLDEDATWQELSAGSDNSRSGISAVTSVTDSSGQRHIVLCDQAGRVLTSDFASPGLHLRFRESEGFVRARTVEWGVDGRAVAAGGFSSLLILFDPDTFAVVAQHRTGDHIIGLDSRRCEWAGGTTVIAAAANKTVTLARAPTLETIRVLELGPIGSRESIGGVALARDLAGNELVVGFLGAGHVTWDPVSGKVLDHVRYPIGGPTYARCQRVTLPDGVDLIAHTVKDGVAILDGGLATLAQVPISHSVQPLAFGGSREGLFLAIGARDGAVQVMDVNLERVDADGNAVASPDHVNLSSGTLRPADLDGLITLAQAGICPSLGLLVDLTRMLGGDAPSDPRLDVLATSQGFRGLRELGWAHSARIGLAALALTDLAPCAQIPVPAVESWILRRELGAALSRRPPSQRAPALPIDLLRSAFDSISERLIGALRAVGPRAVSADPLLPLRLRDRSGGFPMIEADLARLVAAAVTVEHGPMTSAGTPRRSAGVAGITRMGKVTALPQTQLALPPAVFEHQLLNGNLLYHQFEAEMPQPIDDLTILLDTSPATFGAVEKVLRTVAHALVEAVWEAAGTVDLVFLSSPQVRHEIRQLGDLPLLWCTRSLHPPQLAEALTTASSEGPGVTVLLAERRLISDQPVNAASSLRILTVHQPGDPPHRPPAARHRLHLAPEAQRGQVALAVRRLLGAEPR